MIKRVIHFLESYKRLNNNMIQWELLIRKFRNNVFSQREVHR